MASEQELPNGKYSRGGMEISIIARDTDMAFGSFNLLRSRQRLTAEDRQAVYQRYCESAWFERQLRTALTELTALRSRLAEVEGQGREFGPARYAVEYLLKGEVRWRRTMEHPREDLPFQVGTLWENRTVAATRQVMVRECVELIAEPTQVEEGGDAAKAEA